MACWWTAREKGSLFITRRQARSYFEIAEASPAQADAAVLAADSAFAEWGQTTPKARAECLLKLADSIEQNALEFARLESQNCGKPLHCVINDEIPAIVDVFRFLPARPVV